MQTGPVDVKVVILLLDHGTLRETAENYQKIEIISVKQELTC